MDLLAKVIRRKGRSIRSAHIATFPHPYQPATPRARRHTSPRSLALAVGALARKLITSPSVVTSPSRKGALLIPQYHRAHDAELDGLSKNLRGYTFEGPQPDDNPPLRYRMQGQKKLYGVLERDKARIAFRGDRMTPGLHFDDIRIASHMPSQAGARILFAAVAAQGFSIQPWDVPEAYVWAPNDSRYRVVMAQPPRSDDRDEAPGKVCVI